MESANSSKAQRKNPFRRGVKNRVRKLKSMSNRSQPCSTASTIGLTCQLSQLKENNRDLTTALEGACFDLSSKDQNLKDMNEILSNVMLAKIKLREMRSSVTTFTKFLEEALDLLSDTNWPQPAQSMQPAEQQAESAQKNLNDNLPSTHTNPALPGTSKHIVGDKAVADIPVKSKDSEGPNTPPGSPPRPPSGSSDSSDFLDSSDSSDGLDSSDCLDSSHYCIWLLKQNSLN